MFKLESKATDAAALALISSVGRAIASKGNPDDPRTNIASKDDPNPYTAQLSAYDLARLISYVGGPQPDAPRKNAGEQVIASMVTTVAKTRVDMREHGTADQLRRTRAQWIQYEAQLLGISLPTALKTKLDEIIRL